MASSNRDLELVRRSNRVLVATAVRMRGPISRTDLAHLTGLSATSIGRVIDELMEDGDLVEVGQTSGPRGRPKALVDIDPEARVIAGVKIGPESVEIGVADYKCDILLRRAFDQQDDPATALDAVVRVLGEAVRASGKSIDGLAGVGVAVAGLADPVRGVMRGLTNRDGWEGLEVGRILGDALGCPVVVENDVRAVALSSQMSADAESTGSTLYVHVCGGIGAAYIGRDKALHRGSHDAAALIGHTKVQSGGPECGCGRSGCLETLASDIAFIHAIWPSRPASAAAYTEVERVRLVEEGVRLAQCGDDAASAAFRSVMESLGVGIGNAVMILDPDSVVVSGATIDCAPEFTMDALRRAILRNLWTEFSNIRIAPHTAGPDGILKGAVGLVVCEPYLRLQWEAAAARSVAGFRLP